jgi:hypothetical protein
MKVRFGVLQYALTAEDAKDAEERQRPIELRNPNSHNWQQSMSRIVLVWFSPASSASSAVRACMVSI